MAPGGFVKNRIQSLSFVATLAVVSGMISWGSALAQTTPSTPTDQPTPQTQPTPTPDTPPATQQRPSSQTPDQAQTPSSKDNPPAAGTSSAGTSAAGTSAAGTAAGSDSQAFSGTIEKSGDKYVLKDDAGKTYEIDHQDDVKKFEGKRVRVQGKLDDSGTKIMVK